MPVGGTGRTVTSTGVDRAVPLPDGDGALRLACSTVTEPVPEELVALFDAIAASLRLEPSET